MPEPANEGRELDPSILDRARRLIADKMGKFSVATLGAGMATSMAASVNAVRVAHKQAKRPKMISHRDSAYRRE